MIGRGRIGILSGIPPFLHALEGVSVCSAVKELAAAGHPVGQMRMRFRGHRLHIGIRHQKHANPLQGLFIAQVFHMHNPYAVSPFEHGQGQAEEVRQVLVLVLEHQGIGHQDGVAGRYALPFGHLLQGARHYLHHRSEIRRDAALLLSSRLHGIWPFVNALRPRHNLVAVHLRIQELGREGGLVVTTEVFPVPRGVFDGVCEEKEFPAGGGRHRAHTAVFQEGRFKDALFEDAAIIIGGTGGSRPHLCDVAVHTLHRGQGGFRAHNLPFGIVD